MPQGISLHVGLNSVDPNGYGGWSGDLDGCEPDARDMQKLAGSLDYKTSMLLTKQATSSALLTAVVDAAKTLKSGDAFFLTFSGHGSQSEDVNGEEPDELDETWCLYDRQVLDDEMYAMYRKFAPGVRIFVLSDSCHSGTVIKTLPPDLQAKAIETDDLSSVIPSVYKNVKGPIRYRLASRKAQEANNKKYKELFAAVQLVAGSDIGLDAQAGVLLISGCLDNQLSADLGTNGLFTKRLLEARQKVGAGASFQALYKAILSNMPPGSDTKLDDSWDRWTGAAASDCVQDLIQPTCWAKQFVWPSVPSQSVPSHKDIPRRWESMSPTRTRAAVLRVYSRPGSRNPCAFAHAIAAS